MALSYIRPTSLQGHFDCTAFFSETEGEQNGHYLRRTLAPEWFPQSGVQLTWPHEGTDWAYMLDEVTDCYVRLAFEIAKREPLLIVAPDVEAVKKLLDEKLPQRATAQIRYFECPTNDTWARDHGFLTVVSADGAELLDFRFNGWGGKFEAALDNAINARLVASKDAPVLRGNYEDCLDFELEGGSIETDGYGTLLTTSECVLNANRGVLPQGLERTKETVENVLGERLGVDHFLWLDHGYLAGDDTDSHIDTLARLCPDDTIVYVKCTDPADEHYEALKAMEEQLTTFRTPKGEPYRLLPLPMASAIYDEDGERLPATYANYLVVNGAVLYPTYAQSENDAKAADVIRQAFPGFEVVGVDCRALIRQHGSLHCATMQFPRGVM